MFMMTSAQMSNKRHTPKKEPIVLPIITSIGTPVTVMFDWIVVGCCVVPVVVLSAELGSVVAMVVVDGGR